MAPPTSAVTSDFATRLAMRSLAAFRHRTRRVQRKTSGKHRQAINDAARGIDRAVTDQPKETNDFARALYRRERVWLKRRLSMHVRDKF